MEKFIYDLLSDDMIEEALSLYGAKNHKNLGGFENFVFEFEIDGKAFILRLSHSSHRSIDEVNSEIDFIYFLANNNANVAVPIRNKENTFTKMTLCKNDSYFTVAAFEKAEGERPTRDLVNNEMLLNYGKTIGQFHNLTKMYVPSKGIMNRFSWENDVLLCSAKTYLKEEDMIIYDKYIDLKNRILEIPKTIDNYGLLHTDVHFGNFLIKNNQLCVFDFDDASYQYFISDIAIALFYYISAEHNEELRKAKADNFMTYFMKGYLEENNLAKEDFLLIDLFLKLREYVLYFVIHRSCNLETDEWAKRFVNFYRNRLIDDVRFVDIDYCKYYK